MHVYFGAADDVVLPGLFAATLPLPRGAPGLAFACALAVVEDVDTGPRAFRPPAMPAFRPRTFSPTEVAGLFRRIDNWIPTDAAVPRWFPRL